ncbi:hypothetical protein LDC_2776 [sediment metagenome]|uniref:Uncharacterized protein n=1 Tax=sediment metagenome TaxID=749907 RepID=D9PMJ8_9ZZZZ
MDNKNLFFNLKLSSFKIFYKTNQIKELKFKQEKISATLNIIKKDPVFPEQINDFIFRIDDNINEFIFAGESIFLIKDNILSEIKTENEDILNIIKRAFFKKNIQNLIILIQNTNKHHYLKKKF